MYKYCRTLVRSSDIFGSCNSDHFSTLFGPSRGTRQRLIHVVSYLLCIVGCVVVAVCPLKLFSACVRAGGGGIAGAPGTVVSIKNQDMCSDDFADRK